MVKITSYQKRIAADGRTFFVLELEGQLQVQQSLKGGQYACRSKCTIPFTGTEDDAKGLIDFTLPGTIEKTSCDPYEFENPQTKEKMILDYRYSYKNPENLVSGTSNPNIKMIEAEVH